MGGVKLTDEALATAVRSLCAKATAASLTDQRLRTSVLLEEAAVMTARRTQPEHPAPPKSDAPVIVIDDNDHARSAFVCLLRKLGHPVLAFSSGEEALTHLSERPQAALILLDLLMPIMDGWAFHERLLEDPRLALIPVIAISESTRIPPASVPVVTKADGMDRLVALVSWTIRQAESKPLAPA